jgi:hypothetical protein
MRIGRGISKPRANMKTNNAKITPWAVTVSKWITVYHSISQYIKVNKGGRVYSRLRRICNGCRRGWLTISSNHTLNREV